MSGNRFLADTNTFIYLLDKHPALQPLLESEWVFSFITEIELLAFPKLSSQDRKVIQSFLSECFVINLENEIKLTAVDLRIKYKVKLPDAIIAATSIWLDFPLFTMDKGFKKIDELNSIIL